MLPNTALKFCLSGTKHIIVNSSYGPGSQDQRILIQLVNSETAAQNLKTTMLQFLDLRDR